MTAGMQPSFAATKLHNPDFALSLPYAARLHREALATLWALDEQLGHVVRTTSEPLIGHMRLVWWHDQLCQLQSGDRPGEPLLASIAVSILAKGPIGPALAKMVAGWEVLLDPLPLDESALAVFSSQRGGQLFALSATLLGTSVDPAAGEGWALVDFAGRCSDADTRMRAIAMAKRRLSGVAVSGRSLRILTRLAQARVKRWPAPLSRWTMLRAVLG